MLERTLIFVDTSYLLASFYNSWETGARSQLEVDLPEVVRLLTTMAVNQLDQPVHRQNWYDGIPDSGPHRYQRSLRSEPGVQLRAGQLIEWGDRRTQKAVDTRLVADMVVAAQKQQFSDFILVSGDADMLPGVHEAVDAGIRVHLYGFGWDSMSSNLRFACDSTTILDPREDFRDCMRLEVLEGPLPPEAGGHGHADHHGDSATGHTGHTGHAGHDGHAEHDRDEKPEERARYKPIGDAEPVEDLAGVQPVPDYRTHRSTGDAANAADAESTEDATAPAGAAGTSDTTGTADAAAPAETANGKEKARGRTEQDPAVPALPGDEPACSDDLPESTTPAPKPGPLPGGRPNPSMMAPRRRLRSRYVPLPDEVWHSGDRQSPFDIGEQYAVWWFHHAASTDQKEEAHTLTGGLLPQEINRPLLQFACETLHEYTLTEYQRVHLRDGFHSGIRGVLLSNPEDR
ncbi:NYN domain-containing protein [Corynebacterium nuruki]|uniref:NYN domain-containing protein n=1 Tax=Corynebacterium nuruki TaxID=1032851 RepID=UPI000248770E|nr:NYN domain-containing protein [Corynebacterium nuruki]